MSRRWRARGRRLRCDDQAGEIEVERINDTKLSLGAENLITVLLANRGRTRTHSSCATSTQPVLSDATIMAGTIAPFDIHEARYTSSRSNAAITLRRCQHPLP